MKEQDVHISQKYTCAGVTIMDGVKQQRHKKINNRKESDFPCNLFCFVFFEITKVTVVTPKVTFDIYPLC